MHSPLLRIKALIWVHSLIAAILVIALFHMVIAYQDRTMGLLFLPCGFVWALALPFIREKARSLRPEERTPATGLPDWLLTLFAVGQLMSLGAWPSEWLGWLIPGQFLVLGTVVLRGLMSRAMDVPMHRGTWTACVLILGAGFLRHLMAQALPGILMDIIMSC